MYTTNLRWCRDSNYYFEFDPTGFTKHVIFYIQYVINIIYYNSNIKIKWLKEKLFTFLQFFVYLNYRSKVYFLQGFLDLDVAGVGAMSIWKFLFIYNFLKQLQKILIFFFFLNKIDLFLAKSFHVFHVGEMAIRELIKSYTRTITGNLII